MDTETSTCLPRAMEGCQMTTATLTAMQTPSTPLPLVSIRG